MESAGINQKLADETGGNSAPEAVDDTASVDEDGSVLINVLSNDTDANDDALILTEVSGALNGVAEITDGQVSYTPNADFNGSETLSYTVSDGNGGTDTGTVSVTVNPVNDAPVANPDEATLTQDAFVLVDVLANDSDDDNDTLSFPSFAGATNGTAVIENDQIRYTPEANFNGSETLVYTVSDGQGGTDTATLTLTISPENDAPVASDDAASVDEGAALTLSPLANDTDIDQDALTTTEIDGQAVNVGSVVTLASGASVELLVGGQLDFVQNGAFDNLNTGESTQESFDYRVSDGQRGDSFATIDVTINGQGTAPMPIGEAGTLTVAQTAANQWHSVTFGAMIENAVVVLGPLSNNDTDPATMRVRNVTDTGFEFQIDENDYQDGIHGSETVNWLAVSEGSHVLANGSTLVEGTASAGRSYANVSFGEALTNAVVLHDVTSINDPDAVISRVRNVDSDGFQVRIRKQEQGTSHVAEEISWIAIEAGTGFGFDAGLSGDDVNHVADSFVLAEDFANAPVLLADMQTRDGGIRQIYAWQVLMRMGFPLLWPKSNLVTRNSIIPMKSLAGSRWRTVSFSKARRLDPVDVSLFPP